MVTAFAPFRAAAARGAAIGWTAILRGALPTAMVAVTVRFTRSTTETSLEPSLATHAVRPSEAMATQCGVFPTGTAAARVLAVGGAMSRSARPRARALGQQAACRGRGTCGEAPAELS